MFHGPWSIVYSPILDNKNASRFREALCVLRYRLLRLHLSKHKTLTGQPGGSGHGHSTEAVLIHVGRYSMTERGMSQGEELFHELEFPIRKSCWRNPPINPFLK
jgi:hypothetical protein